MGGLRQKLRKVFGKNAPTGSHGNLPESTAHGAKAAAVRAATQDFDGPAAVTSSGDGWRMNDTAPKVPAYLDENLDKSTHDTRPLQHNAELSLPADAFSRLQISENQTPAEEDIEYLGESQDPVASSNPDYSEDTTVQYRRAEPVTHETVRHDVHEVREEMIDREIHEYHEIRHIQPVIQTEVLPARHFLQTENGLREITHEM